MLGTMQPFLFVDADPRQAFNLEDLGLQWLGLEGSLAHGFLSRF